MNRCVQAGQAMTEFLLVTSAVVLALFYPYLNGDSAITLLLRSLMRAWRARSFLVSVL